MALVRFCYDLGAAKPMMSEHIPTITESPSTNPIRESVLFGFFGFGAAGVRKGPEIIGNFAGFRLENPPKSPKGLIWATNPVVHSGTRHHPARRGRGR
jgi:hypothetical protein